MNLLRKCAAEFIGAFAIVFAGCGAVAIDQISGGAVSHVGVAATFGLVIMVMIYATGHISGAHFNPAVTIAFAVTRHFPRREIAGLLASLPALSSVVWAQEEPRNMGARAYVAPLLRALMPETLTLRQASRPEWSSPAEGKMSDHMKGQRRIIREAFAE